MAAARQNTHGWPLLPLAVRGDLGELAALVAKEDREDLLDALPEVALDPRGTQHEAGQPGAVLRDGDAPDSGYASVLVSLVDLKRPAPAAGSRVIVVDDERCMQFW